MSTLINAQQNCCLCLKFTVDLANCEIRGSDYMETRQINNDHAEIAALVAPWGVMSVMYLIDNSNPNRIVEVQQSVIICQLDNPRTGHAERYLSPVIPKDKISLSFHLENQKTTTLYVDKTDHTRYYFDLDFLFA